MTHSLRWAFRFTSWTPSQENWMKASQCIQLEEKDRIGKFVFRKDAKSSLSGRLMLRKAIMDTLHIPWDSIKLERTDKGKPYLVNDVPGANELSVNVSHQGDFAVLAAENKYKVGVDVMKIEERGNKSVDEFFRLMFRQFTTQEWSNIRQRGSELEQLSAFYRFWTLKESYVKALGVGIGINLQTIDFHIHSSLSQGTYTCDTQVYVEGALQPQWRFEETLLDEKHCVATALLQRDKHQWPTSTTLFNILTFDELIHGGQSLSEPDEQYWLDFSRKSERPGGR